MSITLDVSVEQATALDRWGDLSQKLHEWFYEPDLEALKVTLSCAIAHYFKEEDPVWLMVLGPSGTGKSSVIMTPLSALDEVYSIDDLTPTTLLSGYRDRTDKATKKKDYSLLHNIGTEADRSGIIIMPDFTCFMSKRDEQRKEIVGQLRKVYDGYLDRACGATEKMEWHGKVTMIVSATPAVERAWSMMRDLGERFMQIRWGRGNGVLQATAALRQIGNENRVKQMIKELTMKFVDSSTLRPVLTNPEAIGMRLVHLAEIIAVLRAHVHRHRVGLTEVIDFPVPEGPTRIIKSMVQVIRAHATLMRKMDVDDADYRIGRRLGMDSIPPERLHIVKTLADSMDHRIGFAQLVRLTPEVKVGTLQRALEDLEALEVITIDSTESVEKTYQFTPNFVHLWTKAQPVINL